MISLIYDISTNKLIECIKINTSFSNTTSNQANYVNNWQQEYEIVISINDDDGWGTKWYQSMFSNDGRYESPQIYKRDIHIEEVNTILYNCYISSYQNKIEEKYGCYNSFIDDVTSYSFWPKELTIKADYISIGCDSFITNQYRKYYRDLKIERLLT